MFDKLKKIAKIKNLQKSVQGKEFKSQKNGVRVVIDGSFKIKEVSLNSDLDKNEQEKTLKKCLNEAFKKARLGVAKEFSQGM